MLTADPDGPPGVHRFTTTWNEQPFTVEVDTAVAADVDEAGEVAGRALDWLGGNQLALTAKCAEDLLALYHDEWADGDERADDASPMDADRFRRRLSARALTLSADGTRRVVFDDDGMFSDHAVVVETDADQVPTEVFLEG